MMNKSFTGTKEIPHPEPIKERTAFAQFSWVLRRTLYPLAVTLEMIPKIAFRVDHAAVARLRFSGKVRHRLHGLLLPDPAERFLALTSLSEELLRFARSTSAGAPTTFFRIRLPAALPQLFVGISGAAVNATLGATMSDWVGGDSGLG